MSESNRQDLLKLLKQFQANESFLSPTALEKLSDSLNLPNNEIFGVSSFYSFLSLKPRGRYVIRICKSLPCHMQNARMIIDGIQEMLGISPGEVSKDGQFSFELTNCIGACDLAPAMLINDDVHGHLTPQKLSKVLKEYT